MSSESANGGPYDEERTATIRTFSNHEAAELAAANLEAHGIKCWLNADDCGGMYPNLTAPGGVRLLVRALDAEAAVALLNAQASSTEITQIEAEAAASIPLETAPLKKLAMGQIISGLVVGVIIGILICLLYQWADNLGTKTHYHYTKDGKTDEAWVYRDGHLVEFLKDRNLDGIWDYWVYYEHDRRVRSELDNNFDGKPDEWWTFHDDGTDVLERDTDFNGIPDNICTYKYGVTQQEDMKPNGSKFSTEREIFKNGVLTEIWRGGDSNGHFKEVVQYDPCFNPISTNTAIAFQLLSPPPK